MIGTIAYTPIGGRFGVMRPVLSTELEILSRTKISKKKPELL
ncbi:MAG: hypothetical protein WC367_04815 [Methanoregula sp.]|jgi:hypothetical protein